MTNQKLKFVEFLDREIKKLVLSEREHIGGKAKEVHTMNLLFGAFFGKENISKAHKEIMKTLQGFEMQTLIIDKAIDKPNEIKDWDMRIVVGFILQSVMTERFYASLKKLNLPFEI